MSTLSKIDLTFLPVTVVPEVPELSPVNGFLVQAPSKGGNGFSMHPTTGSAMMHGSPLGRGLPLFLYQTVDEVDEALKSFLGPDTQTPVYFSDPTGDIEHFHGPQLAYNWPSKCKGVVTLRVTM